MSSAYAPGVSCDANAADALRDEETAKPRTMHLRSLSLRPRRRPAGHPSRRICADAGEDRAYRLRRHKDRILLRWDDEEREQGGELISEEN